MPKKDLSLDNIGATMIAFSFWTLCISDLLLSIGDSRSQYIKITGYVILLLAISLRPRFHRRIYLAFPLTFCFSIGMIRTFNMAAGIDELLRFMFPLVITFAIYAYRESLEVLLSSLILIALTNNIFQCYFYFSYASGLPLLLPARLDNGVLLRAQGWIGFFSEYAFLNFCAFITLREFGKGRASKYLANTFLLFSILAFSLKLIAVTAAYPLLKNNSKGRFILLSLALISTLTLLQGSQITPYTNIIQSKISLYLTEGNSARTESYRVMAESLSNFNILGEGLGGFGGPASTTYNSPLYSKYNFNWFGLEGILKTTDTFYPHLFVELGLLGGTIWLYMVILYGQGKNRNALWWYVLLAFCIDNLASMGFLSPAYVFSAILVMYSLSYKSHINSFWGCRGKTHKNPISHTGHKQI